jgi:hypothetical protein
LPKKSPHLNTWGLFFGRTPGKVSDRASMFLAGDLEKLGHHTGIQNDCKNTA